MRALRRWCLRAMDLTVQATWPFQLTKRVRTHASAMCRQRHAVPIVLLLARTLGISAGIRSAATATLFAAANTVPMRVALLNVLHELIDGSRSAGVEHFDRVRHTQRDVTAALVLRRANDSASRSATDAKQTSRKVDVEIAVLLVLRVCDAEKFHVTVGLARSTVTH